MADGIKEIKKRMDELENLIRDAKGRLPAHSTKPPIMMELLDYEDEYAELENKLKKLKNNY
ncbi:MAG: V-type ATPase 116kDa subunit family protein [Desulfobacteraceae bacterium]|nr:V-type ATPase 116kDa subunit family protein [Desulfobacteraceae bacterium]